MLLLRASCLALFTVVGCRGPEAPPPPPATVDVAQASRTDAASSSAPEGTEPPSTKATAQPIDPPPPGMYAIHVNDRSNTCPADESVQKAGPTWITFRPANGGRWTATLPVNTGVGAPAMDRADVALEIGASTTSELRPDRTCNYQIRRTMTVLEVSPTRLVVQIRSEYTEAVNCTLPRKPASCIRDAVVTYTLTRPFCASRCIATPHLQRDGGVEATCICDDAGAR